MGVSSGDCAKCREPGIDYSRVKTCLKCGTDFKYVATRTGEARKINNKRLDLIFIELEDYKKALGKTMARDSLS